jgi:hypothetical protein
MAIGDIAADLAEYSLDPAGFVAVAFEEEPREFQSRILADIRDHLQNPSTQCMPCRIVVASGHGVGKTALMGMLTVWALSTCEDARVEATACTGQQLFTKTVPEIQAWVNRSINSDWFEIQTRSIRVKESPSCWRADFLTWEEANPQAFAGLHNYRKRILILFDEACTIPQQVWEAKFGTFTDPETEIIMLAFSQEENAQSYFSTLFGNASWRSYASMRATSREPTKRCSMSGPGNTARTRTSSGCACAAWLPEPAKPSSSTAVGSKRRRPGVRLFSRTSR